MSEYQVCINGCTFAHFSNSSEPDGVQNSTVNVLHLRNPASDAVFDVTPERAELRGLTIMPTAEFAARYAPGVSGVTEALVALGEVVDFLDGSQPLGSEHRYFGESAPSRVGPPSPYWWRTVLRERWNTLLAALSALSVPSSESGDNDAVAWEVTNRNGVTICPKSDPRFSLAECLALGMIVRPLVYGDTRPAASPAGLGDEAETISENPKSWAAWKREAERLQAFKDYVHQRLDAMGVPVDPESPHKAAGCRIGGRLDYVEQRLIAAATAGLTDAAMRYALAHRKLLRAEGSAAVEAAGVECEKARADFDAALATRPPAAAGVPAESRMAQAYPTLSAFFDKHALPSKLPPSCLRCGHTTPPERVSIGHAELPNIVLCTGCAATPSAGYRCTCGNPALPGYHFSDGTPCTAKAPTPSAGDGDSDGRS